MADKLDPTEEKLSLSMPSLRRRRGKRSAARRETDDTTSDTSAAEPAPAPAEEPADPAPVAEAPPEPAPAVDSGTEDTTVLPEVAEAPPEAEEDAGAVGSTTGLASGPIPGTPSPPVAAARAHPEDAPSAVSQADRAAEHEAPEPDTAEDGSAPWRERVDLIPMLPGRIAALVTGAVVGLAGTALTYAGLQGCSSVRGTSTCGAPGFILLFAILVILVLLGSVLLSVWQVEGAGSASVLGVGLTTVVVILFLTNVVFSPWMFLVVPLVAALAYLGSWWVTTNFTEEPLDPWST